jgi:hypothetical protein
MRKPGFNSLLNKLEPVGRVGGFKLKEKIPCFRKGVIRLEPSLNKVPSIRL